MPCCLGLSQKPLPKQVQIRTQMEYTTTRRPEILTSSTAASTAASSTSASGIRVFVLSDLHTDYTENMTRVKCLSATRHNKDVLLVAGDVAEKFDDFVFTMSLFKDRFQRVLFVPGNHDLWCRGEEDDFHDSLEKLNKLLDACRGLGVDINPVVIDGLGIIPLFSWYHESFDREKDISGIRILPLEMACRDFHACKWPGDLSSQDTSLSLYFDAMNENNQELISEIQRTCDQIIMFSHFVPRQDLCPEKRMLFYPNLPKIIGSDFLELRIRSRHGAMGSTSACHVFGHTHFSWDAVLDGVRYVQAPLAYPREQKRRMNGGENQLPCCVYSDGKFADNYHIVTGQITMLLIQDHLTSLNLHLGLPDFTRELGNQSSNTNN